MQKARGFFENVDLSWNYLFQMLRRSFLLESDFKCGNISFLRWQSLVMSSTFFLHFNTVTLFLTCYLFLFRLMGADLTQETLLCFFWERKLKWMRMSVRAVDSRCQWSEFECLFFGAWFDGPLVPVYKDREKKVNYWRKKELEPKEVFKKPKRQVSFKFCSCLISDI